MPAGAEYALAPRPSPGSEPGVASAPIRPTLHLVAARALQAAVVGGSQIYQCVAQPGGGFAFGQFGVAAVLRDGILHSFAKPVDGPPQWIAPDGAAVTGKVVTKSANGEGNIPELLLDAKQTGGRSGILADTTQILRLNTVGGVAPAGSCDPEKDAITTVPYQADYLFLG